MKCPKCNSEDMYFYESCCKDMECCGNEDRISCNHCDWEYETFYYESFKEKFIEIGGNVEELQRD